MNRKFVLLMFLISSQLFISKSIAQDTAMDSSEPLNMNWMLSSFSFDRPSEDFVADENGNGYKFEKIKAAIKFITLHGTYLNSKKDFESYQFNETSRLLDSATYTFNNREHFMLIIEEVSPDKVKYENFVGVIIVTEIENVLVSIAGAYPKSFDTELRPKYIKSANSLMKD